jgi:hypothetical protein
MHRGEQLLLLKFFKLFNKIWRKKAEKRRISVSYSAHRGASCSSASPATRRPLVPLPLAWTGSCFAWTRRKQEVDVLKPSPTSLNRRVGRLLPFRSLHRRRRALTMATNSPSPLHRSPIRLATLIASPLRTA